MKKELSNKIQQHLIITLKELPNFVEEYIYTLKTNKALRTQLEYAKDIRLFFEFLVKENISKQSSIKKVSIYDLENITEIQLRYFLDYLSEYDKTFVSKTGKEITQIFSNSIQGKSRKLASLHNFFSYLFKNKLISKNVSANIELSVPITLKIKDTLTIEELNTLINTVLEDINIENNRAYKFHQKVKFRDYCIILILAYTGIRISELIQLDIDDIRLENQKMKVVRKGGDEDIVILPERILEDLNEYIVQRKEYQVQTNALFISLHKKRINERTVRTFLEKYRVRAGINIKITPHVFRRTFGTTHYNKHGDMYLTAQVLGHSSAETTRRFYAQPSKERVYETMNSFEFEIDRSKTTDSNITVSKNDLVELSKSLGIDLTTLLNKKNK